MSVTVRRVYFNLTSARSDAINCSVGPIDSVDAESEHSAFVASILTGATFIAANTFECNCHGSYARDPYTCITKDTLHHKLDDYFVHSSGIAISKSSIDRDLGVFIGSKFNDHIPIGCVFQAA